jgi:hypothetical protein
MSGRFPACVEVAHGDAFASVALVVVARELGMARGSDGY